MSERRLMMGPKDILSYIGTFKRASELVTGDIIYGLASKHVIHERSGYVIIKAGNQLGNIKFELVKEGISIPYNNYRPPLTYPSNGSNDSMYFTDKKLYYQNSYVYYRVSLFIYNYYHYSDGGAFDVTLVSNGRGPSLTTNQSIYLENFYSFKYIGSNLDLRVDRAHTPTNTESNILSTNVNLTYSGTNTIPSDYDEDLLFLVTDIN